MRVLLAAAIFLAFTSVHAQELARQGEPPRKENTNYATCHVYVVDAEQAEKLMKEYFDLRDPTAEQLKVLSERYPDAERILGRFDAEIAEEVLTTRSFTLTGTEYVVTA